MKVKEERKIVHSEQTLRQAEHDKLQDQMDQQSLHRPHTIKHVNKVIPSKTLTADINVRIQDDSATDSSVMAIVAVGILFGHILAILTIVICRCCRAQSDTDSGVCNSVDVHSKGSEKTQEKSAEGNDRPLSNHSLKIRPLSTDLVNKATSTSGNQRNLLTSQISLKSTSQTKRKQNQTSRLSLQPPFQVIRSTTDQLSHLSMNSAPPLFRSAPDKRYKPSIKSTPPAFESTKDYTSGLSPNSPVKAFGSRQTQISQFSLKSAPADMKSAPVKENQISRLSIKSAPPALNSTQSQLRRLSMKQVSTTDISTQEKEIQTSRLSLIPEISNTQENKPMGYKDLVIPNTHSALSQTNQLPSRLSVRVSPPVTNYSDNVIYTVKETTSLPVDVFSLTNKGRPHNMTSRHVELKPSALSQLTSKSTNEQIISVHKSATSEQRLEDSTHPDIPPVPSVPENNNSTADDVGAKGVRPVPPFLTGIQHFRRD